MKKLTYLILSFAVMGIFTSCEEQCPLTTTTPTDTTQTTQLKNILIEEFTGVKCVNCPEGHEISQSIADIHSGRVEIVTIHSGYYAVPYPFSLYNFKIPEGVAIDNFIGPAAFWPTAAIDRKLYPGQTEIMMDKAVWVGIAAQQLQEPLKVKINLNANYNVVDRKLTTSVSLEYLEEITDAQSITVLITEDGIIDAQETPTGVDTFYVHRHVLRAVLTNAIGDLITEPTPSGAVITRSYQYTLPSGWNDTNCRVVAFVTRNTAESKEVLQVNAKPVKQ